MRTHFSTCSFLINSFTVISLLFSLGCAAPVKEGPERKSADSISKIPIPLPDTTEYRGRSAPAAEILSRREIPILCYHQIRDWTEKDGERARDYIVPPDRFREQMKMLADSGYHTVSPDELFAYLNGRKLLPEKSVMLSFDDTDDDQYSIAIPEMKRYGFKGVFFIMTVSLGRKGYMTAGQVKELSDAGHTIGCHTWDHHNVKQYTGGDWELQADKPMKQLQQITGKPMRYFAFPFGLWNPQAIPQLKQRGFVAAFQLSGKREMDEPLFTIRRIIVPGAWSTVTLRARMKSGF